MSTRSQIAKLLPDGKVKSVYCHSDGYPEHNGDILLNHYNTDEKVDELIALGWLSFLDEHPNPLAEASPRKNFEVRNGDIVERQPFILKTHSFDEPQDGVTVAYHRDRGEDFRMDEWNSIDDFLKTDIWSDYLYLWKDGKWFITYNDNKKELIELTDDIVKNGIPEYK